MNKYFFSVVVHFVLLLLLLSLWSFDSPATQKYENAIVVDFSDRDILPQKKSISKKPTSKTSKPKSTSKKEVAKKEVKPSSQKPKAQPKEVDTDALAKEKSRIRAQQAAIVAQEKAAEQERERESREAEKKAEKVSYFKSLFEKSDQITKDKAAELAKTKSTSNDKSKSEDTAANESSNIEGAIQSRKVLKIPSIKDKSQKEGKVVVKICVDSSGKVISSKYTQIGSTTTDSYLIKLAEKGAKGYEFSKSSVEQQCGRVIIEFTLRA